MTAAGSCLSEQRGRENTERESHSSSVRDTGLLLTQPWPRVGLKQGAMLRQLEYNPNQLLEYQT
jgi:hypothetical protein